MSSTTTIRFLDVSDVDAPANMRALDHYWNFVVNAAGSKTGETMGAEEFKTWFDDLEAEYFGRTPDAMHALTNMTTPYPARFLAALTTLTKGV